MISGQLIVTLLIIVIVLFFAILMAVIFYSLRVMDATAMNKNKQSQTTEYAMRLYEALYGNNVCKKSHLPSEADSAVATAPKQEETPVNTKP